MSKPTDLNALAQELADMDTETEIAVQDWSALEAEVADLELPDMSDLETEAKFPSSMRILKNPIPKINQK